MKDQSLVLITHKEYHAIMKRPRFKGGDLWGQDAIDYDDFIDTKIQEFLKEQLILLKQEIAFLQAKTL